MQYRSLRFIGRAVVSQYSVDLIDHLDHRLDRGEKVDSENTHAKCQQNALIMLSEIK
jgi:hypothetical protein